MYVYICICVCEKYRFYIYSISINKVLDCDYMIYFFPQRQSVESV